MEIGYFPLIRILLTDYITSLLKGGNWALVLGLCLEDVNKGRALVLGPLLNLLLSLAFGLVFWACAPIILNPINIKLLRTSLLPFQPFVEKTVLKNLQSSRQESLKQINVYIIYVKCYGFKAAMVSNRSTTVPI